MSAKFTKKMKKEYVILAPDIFPSHMTLIREIFRMYGYNIEIMHYEGQKVIDVGLQYLHNDMCYPAICSIGQLLYAIKSGDYDPNKIALLQFQTGGGCRASNYIWLLRKALKNMGMEHIPVISLSFSGMEKQCGFKLKPMMLIKGIISIAYGDLLMLLKNQILPYEQNEGETDAMIDKWNKKLVKQFRKNKGLYGKSFRRNINGIIDDFCSIPIKKSKKTKVGIVGEIYVKYSQFGNNGLENFLLSQNCEFMVPGVLGFIQYCFSGFETEKHYFGNTKGKLLKKTAYRALNRIEGIIVEALSSHPEIVAPCRFSDLEKLADKVLDRGVRMGEGWLLPAEMVELIEKGYKNIICAQPFGCLPNHIVGKGVIRSLKELYPNSNICPVDYDAGASKVNQENRIKLMLSVEKEELV